VTKKRVLSSAVERQVAWL